MFLNGTSTYQLDKEHVVQKCMCEDGVIAQGLSIWAWVRIPQHLFFFFIDSEERAVEHACWKVLKSP